MIEIPILPPADQPGATYFAQIFKEFFAEITKPLPPEVIARIGREAAEEVEKQDAFRQSLMSEPG